MKLILSLLIAMLFCSCHCTKWAAPFAHPYRYKGESGIALEDGKHVAAKKVVTGWPGEVIAADTIRYKTEKVASYSVGVYNYQKVTYHSMIGDFRFFPRQMDSGKINRFTTVKGYAYNKDLHWMQQMRNVNYIQNGTGAPLLVMNYKNLKTMIPEQHPAFKMLNSYRRQRNLSLAFRFTGYGLMIGSWVGIMSQAYHAQQQNKNAPLFSNQLIPYSAILGAGVVSAEIGLWKGAWNRHRLFEVVRRCNEV